MSRCRVPVVVVLLAGLLPAGAQAAHPAPVRTLAEGRGQAQCLSTTVDGGTVLFRHGALRATGLAGPAPVTLGSGDDCGAVGAGADGRGLAVASVLGADDRSQLRLADRLPGQPFGPFAAQVTTDVALGDAAADAVALGGGQALLSATVDGRPGLVRRDSGGTLTPVALPRPVRIADTSPVGPVVGLDASGRGLVAWAAKARLVAATVAPDGTVGPVRDLGPAPGDFGALRLAVGADGRATVGWSRGRAAFVVRGSTQDGIDPAGRRTGRVRGNVAMAVDAGGAVVAVGTREVSPARGEATVTSAAGSGAFAAGRRIRTGQGQDTPPAAALGAGGRFAVVVGARVGVGQRLDDVRLVGGVAGHPAGPARRVPVGASHVLELTAAVDAGGRPAALLDLDRFAQSPREGVTRERYEIAASVLRAGRARPTRGRVRIAARQRLGRPQAIRARVFCPTRCTVRVTGATTDDNGAFDVSRRLGAGRHVLRVPYDNGGGSTHFKPLRRPATARLQAAVDDARGEWRGDTRVRLTP